MGIDIEGGMLVGRHGSDMKVPEGCDEDLYEWVENVGMEPFPSYYDAGGDDTFYGFEVDDVNVDDIEGDWLQDVKQKAAKFEELTGLKPELIGTQRVW